MLNDELKKYNWKYEYTMMENGKEEIPVVISE